MDCFVKTDATKRTIKGPLFLTPVVSHWSWFWAFADRHSNGCSFWLEILVVFSRLPRFYFLLSYRQVPGNTRCRIISTAQIYEQVIFLLKSQ